MGNEQKVVFDDPDDHAKKGGLEVMCWSCLCGMTMMSTCCGWTLTILWIVILRNLESVEDLAPQTLENLLTWRATIPMLKSNSQGSAPTTTTEKPTPAPTTTDGGSGGQCPGGHLDVCISLCPTQPADLFQNCVNQCMEDCS